MNVNLKQKLAPVAIVFLLSLFLAPTLAAAPPPDSGMPPQGKALRPGMGPGMGPGMRIGMGMYHKAPFGLWRNSKMVADLGLTEEQVAQLKEADFSFREKELKLKSELALLHLQMEKAFCTEPLDEAAITTLAQKIADLKGKRFILNIESRLAFEKLLSADQLQKLKAGFPAPRADNMGPPHHGGPSTGTADAPIKPETN